MYNTASRTTLCRPNVVVEHDSDVDLSEPFCLFRYGTHSTGAPEASHASVQC